MSEQEENTQQEENTFSIYHKELQTSIHLSLNIYLFSLYSDFGFVKRINVSGERYKNKSLANNCSSVRNETLEGFGSFEDE